MNIINAKEEFISFVRNTKSKVLCAKLSFEINYNEHEDCFLREGYTQREYEDFMIRIDRRYDSGYGGQELFGNIWFKDGSWVERGEYDGSEWWVHCVCPEIPKECKGI